MKLIEYLKMKKCVMYRPKLMHGLLEWIFNFLWKNQPIKPQGKIK
jgi:hypothetical protein